MHEISLHFNYMFDEEEERLNIEINESLFHSFDIGDKFTIDGLGMDDFIGIVTEKCWDLDKVNITAQLRRRISHDNESRDDE